MPTLLNLPILLGKFNNLKWNLDIIYIIYKLYIETLVQEPKVNENCRYVRFASGNNPEGLCITNKKVS